MQKTKKRKKKQKNVKRKKKKQKNLKRKTKRSGQGGEWKIGMVRWSRLFRQGNG
jgi:hypothetical protein